MAIDFDKLLGSASRAGGTRSSAGAELRTLAQEEAEAFNAQFLEAKLSMKARLAKEARAATHRQAWRLTPTEAAYESAAKLKEWEKRYKVGTIGLPRIMGRDTGAINKAGVLSKALTARAQAGAAIEAREDKQEHEIYKQGLKAELDVAKTYLTDKLMQAQDRVEWNRNAEKREIEREKSLVELGKSQYELNQLRKPVKEQKSTIYQLLLKQADLTADIDKENLAQEGREALAVVKGKQTRISKMTPTDPFDTLERFDNAYPNMQTVGDIQRWALVESGGHQENAWNMTVLSARSKGIYTDTKFGGSPKDKSIFYNQRLKPPPLQDPRDKKFERFTSYDEFLIQVKSLPSFDVADPETKEMLDRAWRYFNLTMPGQEPRTGTESSWLDRLKESISKPFE
jgi:hypothetical protein